MFSREKAAKTTEELLEHLKLVENVRALKEGQREIVESLAALSDRMRVLETEMRALKAEIKFEALKEAQEIVTSVQGGLNQRLEDLAVRVAVLQAVGGQAVLPSAPVITPRLERADTGDGIDDR